MSLKSTLRPLKERPLSFEKSTRDIDIKKCHLLVRKRILIIRKIKKNPSKIKSPHPLTAPLYLYLIPRFRLSTLFFKNHQNLHSHLYIPSQFYSISRIINYYSLIRPLPLYKTPTKPSQNQKSGCKCLNFSLLHF